MSFRVCIALGVLVALACAQQMPPVPPFLQNESPAVIASFHKVLERGNDLTDAQLDKEVEAWVMTQSASIKNKYTQFRSELRKHQDMAQSAHQSAVAKFSAAAKEADNKLSAIANSPTLTSAQKNAQIEALVAGLPAHVRQEIESAMQG